MPRPPRRRRLLRGLARTLAALVLLVAAGLVALRLAASRRERLSRAALAPRDGHLVPTPDGALHLQETGPSGGRVVLLVHGTGAWSEIWRPVMTALGAAGYRVVAVDLPPFGFSERSGAADYRPETQARRLWAALDARGVGPVILVGHSFGARSAVAAALARPERVERLVLIDAALGLSRPPGAPSAAPGPLVQRLLAASPLRDAVVAATMTNPAMTRRLMHGLVADPERLTEAQLAMLRHPMRQRGTTTAYGAWLPGFLLAPDPPVRAAREALARFPAPVHVVWGALDELTPPADGQDLARLPRCATWDLLPGVGHIPGLEAPDALARTLRARLDQPAPCGATARTGGA
jgi:pimeloyl-ACP methyl ester carboxylesterase